MWIAITKETLYEAKIAALIDACDTAALAEDQDPRSPGIIQGVVNEVRTAVATCSKNLADADTTKIPNNLRDLAVDLITARLMSAIGQALTEDDRDTVKWRRQQLREVAACDLAVDQAEVPVEPEVQSGTAIALIRPTGSRHPFSGLGTN